MQWKKTPKSSMEFVCLPPYLREQQSYSPLEKNEGTQSKILHSQ